MTVNAMRPNVSLKNTEKIILKCQQLSLLMVSNRLDTHKGKYQKHYSCREVTIENETFNTLKNQGYHFQHNFGHGYKTLSNLLAGLMLCAFLIDQIVLAFDQKVQACLEKLKRFFMSWDALYNAILLPQGLNSLKSKKIFYP